MANLDRVGYERLRSFGRYENERIRVEASLAPDDNAETVLHDLQLWVNQRLHERERFEIQREQAEDRTYEIKRLDQEIAGLKTKAEKLKAFLAKHGVSLDDYADLPF